MERLSRLSLLSCACVFAFAGDPWPSLTALEDAVRDTLVCTMDDPCEVKFLFVSDETRMIIADIDRGTSVTMTVTSGRRRMHIELLAGKERVLKRVITPEDKVMELLSVGSEFSCDETPCVCTMDQYLTIRPGS